MTRSIKVAPFKNNISRGFELLVTDEGVPDVPIAQVARKGDAVLFAAAPELLKALLAVRAHLNRDEDADDLAECLEAIDDAISGATGDASCA